MGIGTPSESPAVVVKEIDLTGGVPNTQSTTGAAVINSRWGPVEKRTLVDNEDTLVDIFASPDSSNTISFHEANFFLKYSSKLQVVRIIDTGAKNSVSTTGQTGAATPSTDAPETVKNEDDFNSQLSALDSDLHTFIGKYPGAIGNSLQVQMCPASDSSTNSAFDAWAYKDNFDAAPGNSSFANKKNATDDEVHVAVIDKNGQFTGTNGTVLETYPFMSVAKNAKNDDGTSNYVKDVINERSEYVWMVDFDSDFRQAGAGTNMADSGSNFNLTTAATGATKPASQIKTFNFASGTDVSSLTTGNILSGFDLFEDKDQVEIDFLIAPSMASRSDTTTVVNDLVTTAASLRKDCVVVASPARTDVVNVTNAATAVSNVVTTANTFTTSSYLFVDNNYLKVYDKFNDQFINIAAASSTAGLMAATDLNRAAWFSPAGSRRGQYLGITSIAYTPTKAQRDTLYKASVNPIANIPGAGVILFGDKTNLSRPSAFDRINVRRLFLVLERAIARAAEQVLFEFNDEFTRAEFVNIVEPVLREVKGRRGITDFRVVADETNNTPAVIDRNEFIASIFIKPARSINFVTLNFVAVRTGVDFEEVVGTV
tara:strand:- start:3616 stop:5412 length:1797 start_codon:yes stop_codon:yes gene_type:complete